MSEEEIINVLSNLFFDEYEWYLRGYDTQTKEEDKETIEMAIQGLLDLYHKEKEKNKGYQNKLKAKINECRFLLYSFEKEQDEKFVYGNKESINCLLGQISILNSLLEESEPLCK